jgi:hypothetical protein
VDEYFPHVLVKLRAGMGELFIPVTSTDILVGQQALKYILSVTCLLKTQPEIDRRGTSVATASDEK